MTKSHNKTGFTLIELTMVMVIIGLFMAGFFAYLNIQLQEKRVEQTKEAMRSNTQSLADFTSRPLMNALGQPIDALGNVLTDPVTGAVLDVKQSTFFEQRLPCPAPLNLNYGQVGFGLESCPPSTAAVGTTVNGVLVASNAATGKKIFIGAVPTAAMQSRGEETQDGYRSKILYAVTEDLTIRGNVIDKNPSGAITVIEAPDSSTPVANYKTVTNVPFVLVSTGQNGLRNGLVANTTEASDLENLDNDHVFYNFSGHSTRNGNTYFDDELIYSLSDTDGTSDEPTFCVPNKIDIQTFTSNGTWVKPAGLYNADVTVVGADGGSANCRIPAGSCGDAECTTEGGGDGGTARSLFSADELASNIPIKIGIGGLSACRGAKNYPYPCTWQTSGFINKYNNYYNGLNASSTSFGSHIVLTGGKGATFIGAGIKTTKGVNGTVKGADIVTFGSGSTPQVVSKGVSSSCGGGTDGTRSGMVNGTGQNGSVTVTSYICD